MRNLLLAASAVALVAAAPAFPDRNGKGVVDAANVIPAADELALNEKVVAWDKATGHQLVVATVPSLQGYDIKDYGYQLLRNWGLGRKDVNDGVVLLLAPNERKVRIEVGYGLEPTLTDATTSLIIRDTIVPSLKQGDIVTALNNGVDGIMANAKTDEPVVMTPVDHQSGSGWLWWVAGLLGIGGVGGTVLLRRSARKRREEEAAEEARRAEVRRRYIADRMKDVPPGEARMFVVPDRPARPRTETFRSGIDDPFFGTSGARAASKPAIPSSPPRPAPVRRRDPDPVYVPVVVPTPTPSPSPSYDWGSPSSSSSDSSSSSSSFDSGGGSCGGGGSDSSY